MDKVEYTTIKAPDGRGYNDWPKNVHRLTVEGAAKALGKMLFMFGPEMIENRQAKVDNQFITLKIFWFHDKTGLMAECEQGEHRIKNWYRIGCKHKYVELSMEECHKIGTYHGGNCYHVEKCSKCNHINSYDSSG